MSDDLFCKKHLMEKRCLAGESAHSDNWYCPACDAEAVMVRLGERGSKTALHRNRRDMDDPMVSKHPCWISCAGRPNS